MKKLQPVILVALLLWANISSFAQDQQLAAIMPGYPVVTEQPDSTNSLTPAERQMAIQLLQTTKAGVAEAIKGLTAAQLAFKPAPDRWSIQECLQHIATSENFLWAAMENALKQPANPAKRASITVTDTALIQGVEDRSRKNKTFPELEPRNSAFKSPSDALAGFNAARDQHIVYIGKTDADLRSHVMELPMGTFDTYQFILLIGAHSQRHTRQIEEVKATAGYPK